MGHAINYITVNKRNEIWPAAEDFAFYNTDRGENPSGSYHGNLKIHDSIMCECYDDAVAKIEELDTGWYSDHAVQFKDKSALKPTKTMLALKAKAEKLNADKHAYIEAHSLKNRKSVFIGCKKCDSKLAVQYLKGNKCPLCGNELRADYIVERIKKFDADIKEADRQYNEMRNKQTGKCPARWLVKVEVHC